MFFNTIDTHTAGEPTRIFLIEDTNIPTDCKNVSQCRNWFAENHDEIRQVLLQEPRGHTNMFGAAITPPFDSDADLGVFFLHPDGYLNSCGHASIGVVMAFYNLGWFSGSEMICLETPSGVVSATPNIADESLDSVTLEDIYSIYLKKTCENIQLGNSQFSINVDIVYAGNIFALVDIDSIDSKLTKRQADSLRKVGFRLRERVNKTTALTNPINNNPTEIEIVVLYEQRGKVVRTAAVFGDDSIDRSPCGTGACALMTLLERDGTLGVGNELLFKSLIDSGFIGRISRIDSTVNRKIVNPIITGRAYITGFHTFVHSPEDSIIGFTIK